jgi:hypothetical protein
MVWDVVERGSMLRLKVSQKTALESNDTLVSLLLELPDNEYGISCPFP